MKYDVLINGVHRSVTLTASPGAASRLTAVIDGRIIEADAVRISPGAYSILLGGHSIEVSVEESPEGLLVWAAARELQVKISDPRSWRRTRLGNIELQGRQQVTAPMPGKIVRLLVVAGQQVEAGQGLLVIEAMKMQNEIRSPKTGLLMRIVATEGQTVNAGAVLAEVV